VLSGRQTAYALLMLRANAARKRRSREARALARVNLARKVLGSWHERVRYKALLGTKMMTIFRRVGLLWVGPGLLQHCACWDARQPGVLGSQGCALGLS
jgi:hypothetical protein